MARELKGYARKAEAKTHPFIYDKTGRSWQEGAWRNQSPEMRENLRKALQRQSHD